jgi:hypothetical protein
MPNFELQFSIKEVHSKTINELQQFASAFSLFYDLSKVTHNTLNALPEPWEWGTVKSKLLLSNNKKTVTKHTSTTLNHNSCGALGSIGWDTGIHEWKLHVSGSGGSTTSAQIHWICLGVATQIVSNTYHLAGTTFSHCTWPGYTFYNMGVVSGSDIATPPNTIVTFTLDCDAGTLAFAQNGSEFLKINVPKNTLLYPWVHLHSPDNVVTIVD